MITAYFLRFNGLPVFDAPTEAKAAAKEAALRAADAHEQEVARRVARHRRDVRVRVGASPIAKAIRRMRYPVSPSLGGCAEARRVCRVAPRRSAVCCGSRICAATNRVLRGFARPSYLRRLTKRPPAHRRHWRCTRRTTRAPVHRRRWRCTRRTYTRAAACAHSRSTHAARHTTSPRSARASTYPAPHSPLTMHAARSSPTRIPRRSCRCYLASLAQVAAEPAAPTPTHATLDAASYEVRLSARAYACA